MKKILVLCATSESRANHSFLKFLRAFDIDEENFDEVFFLGPYLDVEEEDSLVMTMREFVELKQDELGPREKFDLIINEFCPVISPSGSENFQEMLMLIKNHSKKRCFFISVVSTNEESEAAALGGKINWRDDFAEIGFVEIDRKKGDRKGKSSVFALFMKNE